jgi:hypothetical protein
MVKCKGPKSAGVVCEMLRVEHEQVYQAIIDAASAASQERTGPPRCGDAGQYTNWIGTAGISVA